MEGDRENPRWEATWALAVGTVAGSVVITLLPAMFAGALDLRSILGLPAEFFLTGIVVPLLLVAGMFLFARLQDRLDRRLDGQSR